VKVSPPIWTAKWKCDLQTVQPCESVTPTETAMWKRHLYPEQLCESVISNLNSHVKVPLSQPYSHVKVSSPIWTVMGKYHFQSEQPWERVTSNLENLNLYAVKQTVNKNTIFPKRFYVLRPKHLIYTW
jgi:hypothetical protein